MSTRNRDGFVVRLGLGNKLIFGTVIVLGAVTLVAGLAVFGGPSGVPLVGEDRQIPHWEGVDSGVEDAGPYFEVTNDWEAGGESDTLNRVEIERLVLEYSNDERTERGLHELGTHDELAEIARSHSADMADNRYLGHVDSDGNLPWERVDDGLCGSIGENADTTNYGVPMPGDDGTYVNQDEDDVARDIVDNWMGSDIHRETLLMERYDEAGIGVYVTENNAVFATQKLCGD